MERLKSSLKDDTIPEFKGTIQKKSPSEDQQFIELKRHSTMQKNREELGEFTGLVHDEPIPFGIEFMKQV